MPVDTTITIKEARKFQREAEMAITEILKTLEAETGLKVRNVVIERSGIVRGFEEPPIADVKIVLVV